jgi:hypothetical protein
MQEKLIQVFIKKEREYRRTDISMQNRWIQEPDTHIRRWIPAGFDAYTWLRVDSEHFQISGNKVIARGVGGHGDSEDELNGNSPEPTTTAKQLTLDTKPGPRWCWQTMHVRVIYQGREWLLKERSVMDVLTVLKATNAIPQRVVGYRNEQRVQRTDKLYKGDTLLLMDIPQPSGQITVWCEPHWGSRAEVFQMTGEARRLEELIRAEIWRRFQIEDAHYWLRPKTRPFCTSLVEIGDQEIVWAIERRVDQQLQNEENANIIKTVEIRMDRESFKCSAPIRSMERIIRETMRNQYGRTDSSYILKMGVCLCTLRQLEKGGNRVDVITTAPGGAPDPPAGWLKTKYRIADGEIQEIFADPKATVEEVGELIRKQHNIKCKIVIKQEGAEIDMHDGLADWLARTDEAWEIIEIVGTDLREDQSEAEKTRTVIPDIPEVPQEATSPTENPTSKAESSEEEDSEGFPIIKDISEEEEEEVTVEETPPTKETLVAIEAPESPRNESEKEAHLEEEETTPAEAPMVDTSEEDERRNQALLEWNAKKNPPKAPKPPSQGKNRSKKIILLEMSGGGEGGAHSLQPPKEEEESKSNPAVAYKTPERLREFAREVLVQEGMAVNTEGIEKVLDKVQRQVCEIDLDEERFITISTKQAMYQQEEEIAQGTERLDKTFRIQHGGKDMWGTPLIAGYTYKWLDGDDVRVPTVFKWNNTEATLGIWPMRPLLNRDLISSLVHPHNEEQDWAVFDADGKQVEVSNLQTGPYQIVKKNKLVQVVHAHDQAYFIPSPNLVDQTEQRFELELEWWILRDSMGTITADQAGPGKEYRIIEGRLNHFDWRKEHFSIVWNQDRGDSLEEQLVSRTLLPGPWEFVLPEGRQISPREFVQGGRYNLIRIAETTLIYSGERHQICWKTGEWQKIRSEFASKVGISGQWRACHDSKEMTEDTAHLEDWTVELPVRVRVNTPTETREIECYPFQKTQLMQSIEEFVGDLSFQTIEAEGHEVQAKDITDHLVIQITPKPWVEVECQEKTMKFILDAKEPLEVLKKKICQKFGKNISWRLTDEKSSPIEMSSLQTEVRYFLESPDDGEITIRWNDQFIKWKKEGGFSELKQIKKMAREKPKMTEPEIVDEEGCEMKKFDAQKIFVLQEVRRRVITLKWVENFAETCRKMDAHTNDAEKVEKFAHSLLSGPIQLWRNDQIWDRKINGDLTIQIRRDESQTFKVSFNLEGGRHMYDCWLERNEIRWDDKKDQELNSAFRKLLKKKPLLMYGDETVKQQEAKSGKEYTVSQNLEEIEVTIVKDDQRYEVKARPCDMVNKIQETIGFAENFLLLNHWGKVVPQ